MIGSLSGLLGKVSIDTFIIILTIILLTALIFGTSTARRRRLEFTKPIVKTELVCNKCGFKEVRDFKEGDYVSKKSSEKCKKCGGDMIVNLIYSIETAKKSRF